jgi:hypothetical protein
VGIKLHSTASSGAQRLPMTGNSALRHNGSVLQRGEIKRDIHPSVRLSRLRCAKIRGDVGCLPGHHAVRNLIACDSGMDSGRVVLACCVRVRVPIRTR